MNKLKKLKITAVALCHQGANPDAHIMLYKSIPGGGKSMKTLEEIIKGLPQEEQDLVNAEIEKAKKEMPADMKTKMDTMEADKKKAEDLAKSLQTEVDTLKINKSKSKDEEEAELMKSMPEAIRKAFEDMKKKTAAAEAVAKAMQEESLKKQYIAKAEIYKSIPAKAEELGDILKSIAAADAGLCEKVENILKASNELIAKGAAFKEIGDGRSANTVEAIDKLEKCVEGIIAKSQGLTKEQAYLKALEQHPEMYEAYLKTLENEEE